MVDLRSPAERRLAERFELRSERFTHAGLDLDLLLPAAADALIDVSAFNRDERLPYWAELWPSARALARFLLDHPPPERTVAELGAGIALPSLALRVRGGDPLITDYYPEALEFARLNALRNALGAPRTRLVDWRDTGLEPHALVLAADVLYEARNAETLVALLPRVVDADGRLLLADPGRTHLPALLSPLTAAGWRRRDLARIDEPVVEDSDRAVSAVQIIELRPPIYR